MMSNAGKKSKVIQIWIILSLLWIWSFEDLAHTRTEYVKYSDLRKPIKGDGSLGNPYQIAHPLHFKEMRDNLGSHFKLTKDLDLGQNWNFKPIGSQKKPFEGTFDGAGKTIRNLKIRRPDEDGVGLFGWTGKNAIIRNVKLEKINIQGKGFVGGLVGVNVDIEIIEAIIGRTGKSNGGEKEIFKKFKDIFVGGNVGGKIEGSYVKGKVNGDWYVGGLVGYNGKEGKIKGSYATGKVECRVNVGGLVGVNDGTIEASYATGKVQGNYGVGGLVGWNEKGTIEASYAKGKVNGSRWVGGLAGGNHATIQTSYATGKVNGKKNVGGLVGANSRGTIEKSYATGKVVGEEYYVGGLVGWNVGTIKTSYATGKVEGKGYSVGGLVGWNYEGTIQTSYATGKVEGEKGVGGLVGRNSEKGTIKTSYATGKVNGKKEIGGFVGANDKEGRIEGKNYWLTGSAKEGVGKNNGKISHIEGKPKFEMILKELDWDLEIWAFPPGKHPRLRWQSSR